MATNPATNLAVIRQLYGNQLTWTASSTAGSSYSVFRGPHAECLIQIGTTNDTAYVDANVSNGTTYYYYVIAIASNVSSVPSNIVYITYVGPPGIGHNPDEGAHISKKVESVIATGVVPAGCGESVRLQRLKGNLAKCSKY